MREDYFGPVGFAREPLEERKRWLGRLLTLVLVVLIALLFYFRVWHVPSDTPTLPSSGQSSELPSG